MNITNNHNLPPEYVMAVEAEERPRNYYSPSMLTDPPRKVHLVRRHYDEITIDAIDRLWALFGTAVHEKLEKQDAGNESEIELTGYFHGYEMKGTSDLYTKEKIVRDWKVTKVFSIIKDPDLEKYQYQLNAYRRMLEQNGYEVKGMEVTLILKDWSPMQAFKPEYPDNPIVTIPIKQIDNIDDWIADRIDLFEDTANLFDDDLPLCTMDEKWQDPEKWAVMIKGKKKAAKLHISKEDAEQHAGRVGGYVEHRPSIPRRCEKYCDARDFCSQYHAEKRA